MNELRNSAFKAVGEYLIGNGWKRSDVITDEQFFYWIDPITGAAHRLDFAFFVQSEREINQFYNDRKVLEITRAGVKDPNAETMVIKARQ